MAWRRILALAPARIFRALRSRARSGHHQLRAIVFDEEGAAVCAAQRELRQIYPQPGWVEHDPKEIFETQREVAREALQKKNIPLKDMVSVGIANSARRPSSGTGRPASRSTRHRLAGTEDRRVLF